MKKYFYLTLILLSSAILMQGFQCASRELTTAKLAMNNKDYEKAETSIKQELTKNPSSQEAYILLVDIKFARNDIFGAAEALKKAQEKVTDPRLADRIVMHVSRMWVECYNNGTIALNGFFQNKSQTKLDSALKFFDMGEYFRPRIADFEFFKGSCYEAKNDTINKLKAYKAYVDIMTPEINLMKQKGLFLGMAPGAVVAKLGKPLVARPNITPQGDTTGMLVFNVDNKEAIFFFGPNGKSKAQALFGLRYDLPDNWLPEEKMQTADFKIGVLQALLIDNYKLNHKEDALKYAEMLYALEPNDEASANVISLYIELNKTNEAIAKLKALTEKEPDNAANYLQLGFVYFNLKDFDTSIEYYEKALKIQPNNELAPRNLGSAFKNKAAALQKKQLLEQDKDKNYKMNPEEYNPFLRKAASYYEKAIKYKKWQDDYSVYADMAEIYYLLENKEQMESTINKLQSLEYTVIDEEKEKYYYLMMRLYGNVKNSDKINEIKVKLEELNKK